MPRLMRKRTGKTGLPPGSVVYDGEARQRKVEISVIDYDEKILDEKEGVRAEEVAGLRDKPTASTTLR